MSKLVDKFNKLLRGSGPSIGFTRPASVKGPAMLLVAGLSGDNLSMAPDVVALGVDALSVRLDNLVGQMEVLKELGNVARETAWGVHISSIDAEDMAQLATLPCDFIIMEAPHAPATVLSERDLGKILRVDPQWSDSLVRALDQVALDALFVDSDDTAGTGLSLGRLLLCHRLASLSRKPMLVSTPKCGAGADLQALHGIGVEGVLHRCHTGDELASLRDMRSAIDALPPYRGRGKGPVILPRLGAAPVEAEAEEEGEEEEEE